MIEFARYDKNGAVSAGPIEGTTWHGVTPEHQFWSYIETWVANGNEIAPFAAPPLSATDVDAERDQRINSGMVWNGVTYQTRPQDRENVAGASILALAAIGNGAQPGDLRWHGEDTDFVWIAADNSTHTFDAPTFFAFAQAMAKHKSAHIFAARAIKDMTTVPADYAANEAYWP